VGHQIANHAFSWQPEADVLALLEVQGVARAFWAVAKVAHWVISDPSYPDNQFQYVDSVQHILPEDGQLPDWLTEGPPHVPGLAPTTCKELRFAIYAHAANALKGV
jgi:hypothetical protein